MKAIFKKHPELDFYIGYIGGIPIPTKQDKYKPLKDYHFFLEKMDGEPMTFSEDYELYTKKKGKSTIQEFEYKFKEQIKEFLTKEHPYPRNIKLEVVISVLMDEKRLDEVDIDNLIKSVLDCFIGLVYEDDSQIVNVYGTKSVHPLQPLNGLFVGIRKLTDKNNSWFKDIKLAYFEYEEEEEEIM
jgi:Holliday junction resolvase RusA-like endonuclease